MSVCQEEIRERYVPIKFIALRLGLTPDAIYKRIQAGGFPAGYRFGGARRWKLSELEDWEAAQRIVLHAVEA